MQFGALAESDSTNFGMLQWRLGMEYREIVSSEGGQPSLGINGRQVCLYEVMNCVGFGFLVYIAPT